MQKLNKFLTMLVLLLTAATGAWAQEVSLLTTLTFGGSSTYSETASGVVSVTATNVGAYNAKYGWLWWDEGSLSVTAEEGYTITKCVFIQNAKKPITDTEAPFEIHYSDMGIFIEDEEWDMDGVTSIEVYGYADAVAVTSVTLSQTSASLNVGETLTLTATVAPDNATDKSVTWSSSNTAVATVAGGVVTAVAAGTATITVTTTDGNKTATCEVTVTDPATKYDLTVGESAHGTVTFTVDGATATKAKKDDVVTVSVTPESGYSPKDVTVRAYTSWGGAGARRRAPGLLDEITVTKNETDGTWSFTMPEANVWVVATYTKNLQNAWIQAIADQTYTGEAIEPTITVKDGETTLTLDTDYTVAYSDNTNAGTATVTVTAVDGSDYSGEATATFTIAKADITMTTAPAAVADLVYSGEAQTLVTAGVASFGTVLYSTDGTTYAEALPTATDAGTYTVYYKVEGDANHNAFDAQTVSVTISAKTATPTIEVGESTPGEVPGITVKVDGTTLTEDTDYTITYKDSEGNTVTKEQMEANPGTYTAVVTLKGNYSGSADQTITVRPATVGTVTLAAQSFGTCIASEGLSLATGTDSNVKLYTVTAINGSEVVLSDALTSAKAGTPLIIYNGSDSDADVTLAVNDEAAEVTYDSEHFKGTLTAKTFTVDDMAAADHYVLSNGHDFVWVKDAGTLAAGKCWIEIAKEQTAGARRLSIAFPGSGTTGISAVETATGEADAWYSLDGRRLAGKPAIKGIYVKNGKKVAVK